MKRIFFWIFIFVVGLISDVYNYINQQPKWEQFQHRECSLSIDLVILVDKLLGLGLLICFLLSMRQGLGRFNKLMSYIFIPILLIFKVISLVLCYWFIIWTLNNEEECLPESQSALIGILVILTIMTLMIFLTSAVAIINSVVSEMYMRHRIRSDLQVELQNYVISNLIDLELTEDSVCSICLDCLPLGEKATVIPICGHSFHRNCVLDWVNIHPTCPYCRRNIQREDFDREDAYSVIR